VCVCVYHNLISGEVRVSCNDVLLELKEEEIREFKLGNPDKKTGTHICAHAQTHTRIYTYNYVCVCARACVCACMPPKFRVTAI